MARPRSWAAEPGVEGHKVTMTWPKPLWREVQRLALDEDTTATALMIEAAQMLLAARRNRRRVKATKRKQKPDRQPEE